MPHKPPEKVGGGEVDSLGCRTYIDDQKGGRMEQADEYDGDWWMNGWDDYEGGEDEWDGVEWVEDLLVRVDK